MGSYGSAFSFLLAVVLLTTLEVEARESKLFSKFNTQADQPQFKPSSEINNYNSYHFEDHDKGDIPTEEFIGNIEKDFSETNKFPRDFDEQSYVKVPQDNKEKDSNDFDYLDKFKPTQGMRNTDASVNGFELNDEEKIFLDEKEEETDGYDSTASYKSDAENVDVKESQGLSDTMTLDDGKYYYKPTRDNTQYVGNSEYNSKQYLKDFEFNSQNQVGFIH